jgi:hypothetical protein
MLKKVCAERGSVTSGWISLDAADLGLIESVYKKNLREGEERLMLAVLESAVEDFQKYVLARKPRGKQLFQHAEGWFLEKDGEGLFSFENICETLGLHPDHIRKGLLVWKEARIKTSSLQASPANPPKLARNRVKHPSIRLSKTA